MFKTQKEIEERFDDRWNGSLYLHYRDNFGNFIEGNVSEVDHIKSFLHSIRAADKEAVREMIENEKDKFACAIVVPESEIPNTIIFNKGAQSALSDLLAQLDKWNV